MRMTEGLGPEEREACAARTLDASLRAAEDRDLREALRLRSWAFELAVADGSTAGASAAA
jgi:hypothetical protein